MKSVTSISTFIITFLLISCSNNKDEVFDCMYDCKYFLGIDDISYRSTSKTLKGQILFSWKNNGGGWNYAIAPNLNISRADDRVGEANTISGEACLKDNLKRFAEGEEFFWRVKGKLETLEGKTIDLVVPPAEIIQDLQVYCEEINVKLIF